ncbi:MAG TPA: hypothetical protein VL326_29995 [Kofleriaceae bacterium]|jgi:hypothetical protein|nr:hypothetical protein [Kofleriaceae bacterium]
MRSALAFVLLASATTAACTSASPTGTETFDSVKDRLATKPTRLYIGSEGSNGTITAKRWTADGWIEGQTPVTISSGELSASVNKTGTLKLEAFEVGVAPIDIPEEVFKKPAQLKDVRVKMTNAAEGQTNWTSDDDATVTLTLDLDLDWSIAVNGAQTPLGTQHLPPVPLDVVLTGAGDHVDASIGLHASGELWDWAGLLELTGLEMSLSAETTDN